ncbi:RelA/SpoT domain-containing protein [Faecalimonas umbilicata]|nr:RelA/SpoT domain-containing protein [Faecalimonas umbilicata]
MNEQYVEERIRQYSKTRILYEEFAEQILNILKAMIKQEYPDIKIASYSKRAKDVESLRKKLRKDKYNENSEITDLAGVRIIAYSRKDIPLIAKIIKRSFKIDIANSVDKTLTLGNDKVGYRGDHYVVSFDEVRVRMPENKKFEGELPRELERRKNLLAGMLELADLEMDAYVESFDNYVSKIEQEIEKGCLKYQINSMSLERFMAWKFPNISPQVFRDVDLILNELRLFGLATIKELNELVRIEFEEEIQKAEWRSLNGIIRNILIIDDADKYFTKVWNPSMNQMNRKNYELYKRFNVDIDRICEENNICVV